MAGIESVRKNAAGATRRRRRVAAREEDRGESRDQAVHHGEDLAVKPAGGVATLL